MEFIIRTPKFKFENNRETIIGQGAYYIEYGVCLQSTHLFDGHDYACADVPSLVARAERPGAEERSLYPVDVLIVD